TVVATCAEVSGHNQSATGPPIGRPISNVRAYAVDAYQQPVPIGVAGELHLAGKGLARGYLKRPEQTADKFIPDPFSRTPGGRLYKSGDLVKLRGDGDIEFIGRIDTQVKVRGYRIELGEIEEALSRHPEVKEGVVAAMRHSTGD